MLLLGTRLAGRPLTNGMAGHSRAQIAGGSQAQGVSGRAMDY